EHFSHSTASLYQQAPNIPTREMLGTFQAKCLLLATHLANSFGYIGSIMEIFFRQILDGFKDFLIGTMLLSMLDEIFLLSRKINSFETFLTLHWICTSHTNHFLLYLSIFLISTTSSTSHRKHEWSSAIVTGSTLLTHQ